MYSLCNLYNTCQWTGEIVFKWDMLNSIPQCIIYDSLSYSVNSWLSNSGRFQSNLHFGNAVSVIFLFLCYPFSWKPNAPFAVYGTPMTKMVNARIWQIIWTCLIYFRKIFYNAQRIKCKGNPKMWRQLIHKFFCNLLLDIILTSIGTRIDYARLQPVLRPHNIESNAQKWTVCMLRPSVI